MNLHSDERELIGKWIVVSGAVDGDETCKRIEEIVAYSLDMVSSNDGGWTKLFVDKNDGRYWELTYPNGEWHGGGPPTLTCVSDSYVRSKYKILRRR